MVDCGVDLERFAPRDAEASRREVGWAPDGTAFLCLGALTERKNVLSGVFYLSAMLAYLRFCRIEVSTAPV